MDVEQSRLTEHVARLADQPRPAESRPLEEARDYVARQLEQSQWDVERHAFRVRLEGDVTLHGVNLLARHRDFEADGLPWFCLGAHVDSRPDSPGADDNASAVAALLEIARLLPTRTVSHPRLNIELVAFDLEENGMLGGSEHVRLIRTSGRDLRGMVSLEMLGYCDPTPGSQLLPAPLTGMYPDRGDFIGIVGSRNSGKLLDHFAQGMATVPDLPVETLLLPDNGESLQVTRLSDHSPFWDAGYPALMVTDTSFLRNPHYHLPSDTPETLDYAFLTRVTAGCLEAVVRLLQEGL